MDPVEREGAERMVNWAIAGREPRDFASARRERDFNKAGGSCRSARDVAPRRRAVPSAPSAG